MFMEMDIHPFFFSKHKNISFKVLLETKMLFMMMVFFCVHHIMKEVLLVALEALSYGLPIITTQVGVFMILKLTLKK